MKTPVANRIFAYRINEANRITFLNQNWLDFAQENQAAELTADRVLGEELNRFIADWETRHLYELIYARVRQTGRDVQFPFRCDSPECRRSFQMHIASLPQGGLDFTVQVIALEPRPALRLLDNSVAQSADWVVICGWCQRIESNGWIAVEEATERKELFGATPPRLTHGICPDCLTAIQRRVMDS
ncbi:MAG: hypothetical protein ACYDAI_10820 [Trichloromonadaceae bacterium]